MDVGYDSQHMSIPRSRGVNFTVLRIARLALAVFIALVALISLCSKLSEARHQTQMSDAAVMIQPADSSSAPSAARQGVSNGCQWPELSVTKQVDPPTPDTGGIVTVTFTITGLERRQVAVVLVQDVSGSMLEADAPSGQSRLELAKAAAITFANKMETGSRVAVVAYSDTAQLVQALTPDTSTAIIAINSLGSQDWWCTNIGDGILTGREELTRSIPYTLRTVKAIILLSDGNANRPPPDDNAEQHALEQAEVAGNSCILIYTIGFGDPSETDPDLSLNEELLRTIAYTTGGEYYRSPDGHRLEMIYEEIALALRNMVITDVLPTGVDLDCALLPATWECITGSGFTTVTIPISSGELVTNPFTVSFTATVNLDPGYAGVVNASGSSACYESPEGPTCPGFENPTTTVGGRKITGVVFEDLDLDGNKGEGERGLPNQTVRAGPDLTATTSATGFYVLRTSRDPVLTVTVETPEGYIVTTPERAVPSSSGSHPGNDIGLYTGLLPEKHSEDINGPPLFEGDTLAYTITVRNISTTQQVGTIIITDALPSFTTYTSGTAHVVPSGTVTVSDAVLTATYTGTLDSGNAITLTFHATVDEGSTGREIDNEAYVTSTTQTRFLSRQDEEGPYQVELPPIPHLNLATNAQVVRFAEGVIYTYTVQNASRTTLTNILVEDSHLGCVLTHPSLRPGETIETSVPVSLTDNRTSTATVTSGVQGYSGIVSGDPATLTVHVIEGISLTQIYPEPSPVYHNDATTFYYSLINRDRNDGVVSGTIHIADTLGYRSVVSYPDLGPSATITRSLPPFIIPRDLVITLTATGWDDFHQVLPVSDHIALTLCPIDTYEQGNGDDCGSLFTILPITPSAPQIHDFSKPVDKDCVGFVRNPGYGALCTFIARPLSPEGAAISLTFKPGTSVAQASDNRSSITSEVRLSLWLECSLGSPQSCYYDLQVKSPVGKWGCGTDYELKMVETDDLWHIWLPMILRNS